MVCNDLYRIQVVEKMHKRIGCVIMLLFLSGCAFGGQGFMIGPGSVEEEYYPDGKLKRYKTEAKTPLADVVNLSGINAK